MPKKKITAETAAEYGRKGGIKSGEVRRQKAEMRKVAKILLDMPIKKGKIDTFSNLEDSRGKNIRLLEAILIPQADKAMEGDTKATELLLKAADLMPNQKVNVEAEITENTGYLDSIATQLINYQDAAKMFNENNEKED